jgi:thiol-disulfide isomerase/thioredoxin
MKYLLTILCSVLVLGLAAQTDPNAPFQKDKNLPAFRIVSVGGKEVTHKNLPKYKYQMIIIFSPDCPHCEHEAAEINKYADKFKNVLMIWDSYKDMPSIRKFAEKYNMIGKPNIIIGRDPEFTLPIFFRPRMTPFVAIYENNRLKKVYEKGAEVFELLKNIDSK